MNNNTQDWTWLIRYSIVIMVTLLLSTAFSNMDLFTQTWVVKGKLSAAKLVQFIAYSGAVITFWVAGQHAAIELKTIHGRWAFLRDLLLPLVSLISVAAAHSISLLLLQPFLNDSIRSLHNWSFIMAILGCAVWLLTTALKQSHAVNEALRPATAITCPACQARNPSTATFCQHCAQRLL